MMIEFLIMTRAIRVRRAGRGLVWLLGGLLAAVVAAPATAAAAPAISFVTPPGALAYPDQDPEGPVGYVEAPDGLRTTHGRPVIGIEADSGTQLVCHPDSIFLTQPCGPPLPGCPASLCASYQPPSPLSPDSSPLGAGH